MVVVALYYHREYACATDIISRYGGEEFAFMCNSTYPVNPAVSIEIYRTEDGGGSGDRIVSLADAAACLARHFGKSRVVAKAAV